jgi:hypothetical protein
MDWKKIIWGFVKMVFAILLIFFLMVVYSRYRIGKEAENAERDIQNLAANLESEEGRKIQEISEAD